MPYKDKEKQNEYARGWIKRRRNKYLNGKSCSFCGSKIKLCLHHKDPSTKVSHNVWSWSKKRRLEELDKCIALCDACHRALHKKINFDKLEHGLKMYNRYGCRCQVCKEAKKIQNAKRKKAPLAQQ